MSEARTRDENGCVGALLKREALAEQPGVAAEAEAVSPIVFVGDSITEQWGHYLPDTFAEGRLINCGVGGETTRMIALRLRSEIEDMGAKGLHLMGGLNDIAQNEGYVSADTIKANLAAMITTARELDVKVWVGSLTPADVFPWNRSVSPASMIAEVNAWLSSSAERLGATYIDYHAVLTTPSATLDRRYGSDGVHLSRAGYEAIEITMRAALGPEHDAREPSWYLPSAEAVGERRKFWLVFAGLLAACAMATVWGRP